MQEYGVKTIYTARPGENKTCIVLECDSIQDVMNISRSGLIDSKKTLEFEKTNQEVILLIFGRGIPAAITKISDDYTKIFVKILVFCRGWYYFALAGVAKTPNALQKILKAKQKP